MEILRLKKTLLTFLIEYKRDVHIFYSIKDKLSTEASRRRVIKTFHGPKIEFPPCFRSQSRTYAQSSVTSNPHHFVPTFWTNPDSRRSSKSSESVQYLGRVVTFKRTRFNELPFITSYQKYTGSRQENIGGIKY